MRTTAKAGATGERVSLGELLRGCTPGVVQTVGYMTVVPLLSEIECDKFASPNEARVSTQGYGKLFVKNAGQKPILLPHGATYIVNEKAQNHAIPHLGIVKGKSATNFDTAMCVQQSQAGYITEGAHELSILPVALREKGHAGRKEQSYNRLWPAIAAFNTRAGLSGVGGHLEKFYEKFTKELDQFVAEFEPVDKQVGVIVLIGGKVAGVERCPSQAYFRSVWRPLVRECYGSMAVLESKKGPAVVPKTRVALRKARSLDDLVAALGEAQDAERQKVAALVNNLATLDVSRTVDERGDLTVDGLGGGSDSFVGQSVRDGAHVVYASLVAAEQWAQKEEWLFAAPFAM
jgi:hypothetical protein